MKFKMFQLLIDDKDPTLSDLETILKIGPSYVKDYYSDWYKIEMELIGERYLWFYIQHENAKLYSDTVLDGETDTEEDNPRSKNQVELKHQFFACYDLAEKHFYLSNYDKKGFVQYYIGYSIGRDVSIKNIYASLEEFQKSITTIESVKFVQHDSLYNRTPDSMFTKTSDLLGFGVPKKLKMQVDYGVSMSGIVKNKLQELKQKYDGNQFEHIVVIGKDDLDIEQSYDFSTVLELMEIDVVKNENGRYDNANVKSEFLLGLKIKNGTKS